MNSNMNNSQNRMGTAQGNVRPGGVSSIPGQRIHTGQSLLPEGIYYPDTMQGPPPSTEKGYIPSYLNRNIGKRVSAEFVVGTNQYTDKTGELTEVGINYFVLYDAPSRTYTMCDMYSLKFLTVLI